MRIIVKTLEEIEKMRVAGRLAAKVLNMISFYIKPGITTERIDDICHNYIVNNLRAIPAPLNYKGFPKSTCISVNHVVCHGIPSKKILKDGDIVNIDIAVIKNGFFGDTSKMFLVGNNVSILSKRLVQVSYECLKKGIKQVKPGNTFYHIAKAVEKHAKLHNFSIVEDFCGHGVGKYFHEDPQVLHYVPKNRENYAFLNIKFVPGMTFTIEPMINTGKKYTTILKDGWTVVTKDRSVSAQWEHTLAVTESGVEVLTKRPDEAFL